MDPVVHHNNPSQSTLSPVSSSRRRAARENETPAQRQKREKAAERQRRKRERDRHVNNLNAAMSYPQSTDPPPPPQPQPPQQPPPAFPGQEVVSPEELARRERVRVAARERQRKHRSLVKQRKMRDLGLEMTSEVLPGMEDVQFRVNGQNEYHPVLHMGHPPPPMNPQDPSFPPPPLTGLSPGHTFATSLLVAVQYMPELKGQLLRTLSLTNEDLNALEPLIADAFEQWDRQRQMHFAEQAKAANGSIPGPSGPPFPDMNDPSANGFGEQGPPHANEFHARFQRSLVAPAPFRNFNPAESTTTATTSTPTSTPGSGPPSDPIDPHLSGVVIAAGGDARQKAAVEADGEGVA